MSATRRQPGDGDGFEIVVRARRRSGQLIMTTARINGVPVDVVIDTGAERRSATARCRRGWRAPQQDHTTLVDVTGQRIAAELGVAREISVGSSRIRKCRSPMSMRRPSRISASTSGPAILLGMHVLRAFKRIAIDFATRKVIFDYDAAALQPG